MNMQIIPPDWDAMFRKEAEEQADATARAKRDERRILSIIDANLRKTEKKAQPLVPQTFFERFVLAVCFIALVGVAVVYGMLL